MNRHRPVKTLAQQVRWQMLWLGAGLFFACLTLVTIFALRSASLITDNLMRMEADSLLRQMAKHPERPLPQRSTLSAYRHWDEIPTSLKQDLERPLPGSGTLQLVMLPGDENSDMYLYYLLHHVDEERGDIYLLSRNDEGEIERLFNLFAETALGQALWLTVIIFAALFFLIRRLIRRTTQPLALLSRWAASLSANPDKLSEINFPIAELNKIAHQLREGVERIEAYNFREQEFLIYASHELRTPLAIIQACLDTLALHRKEAERSTVERALRASANMRVLSTALLWLARESEKPIDKNRVDPRALCGQIIQDHRYLLENRAVEVESRITVDMLEIEGDLLSIIIANLIRNAFQYTFEGTISLEIGENEMIVSNPICPVDAEEDSTRAGYGLGLQLVQRICKKLQWQFRFIHASETVTVHVCWRTR
jgi:signal transduction histidine kinase